MKKSHSNTVKPASQANKGLHPKNAHRAAYDFANLANKHAPLQAHITTNAYGNPSIDFANPKALVALNCALLKTYYDIHHWAMPEGYLCPPIPGRIDYLHYVADLLGTGHAPPKTDAAKLRLLDIGTGASGVYSLLACKAFGWDAVASDIEPASLKNVETIVNKNPSLRHRIELRLQKNPNHIFKGIIRTGEQFDLSVCNPPFHASLEEALKSNRVKRAKLAANRAKKLSASLPPKIEHNRPLSAPAGFNFGGQNNELFCKGGEQKFLRLMIKESQLFATQCRWFTTLVSKRENLKPAAKLLRKLNAGDIREIEMQQGHKITRILAWRFNPCTPHAP